MLMLSNVARMTPFCMKNEIVANTKLVYTGFLFPIRNHKECQFGQQTISTQSGMRSLLVIGWSN